MTASALVFKACLVLGVLSWCVAALLFVRARRDYRGPSGPASWLSPFAMWESANYKEVGAVRISSFLDLSHRFLRVHCHRLPRR